MIISKTPFRISFFGGGTDFPQWYEKEGGAVLSTTIDKYCYISCRTLPPFFNAKYRIVWSHIEAVHTISEILHPAVREGLRTLGFENSTGLEIHHQGDLPARSGMGSSSAFAVGLIKALTALQGRMISRHELALKAIDLEQNILKESVGSQDQVAAAYGGFNVIHFLKGGEIRLDPVTVPQERIRELQSNLVLLYTGSSRNGTEIAAKAIANIPERADVLRRMRGQVERAVEILGSSAEIGEFGKLLDEAWQLKRRLNTSVSNPRVDSIYEAAMRNGALGGKLLGSGGAGFVIFFVPPARREAVLEALPHCLHVPFEFESEGSTLIHYVAESLKFEDRRARRESRQDAGRDPASNPAPGKGRRAA